MWGKKVTQGLGKLKKKKKNEDAIHSLYLLQLAEYMAGYHKPPTIFGQLR